jgi:methionine synthase II (cobalamin-independent)
MAATATANDQLRALFVAGAPLVQVEEDGLAAIEADDRAAHRLAIDALVGLMDGVAGHVSLSILGGDASGAGPEVLYAAPFSSHLFDLILGPDGWRAARLAPRERGLILGVADCRTTIPEHVPVAVWAARYGASMGARGTERIGLAPSAGLEHLPLEVARAKLRRLAEAAAVAGLPVEAMREAMPKEVLTRGAPPGLAPVPRKRGPVDAPSADMDPESAG